jgi:hypothetical protein
VRDIERGLLISEEILRHMLVLLEEPAGTPEDEAAVPMPEEVPEVLDVVDDLKLDTDEAEDLADVVAEA